MKHYKDEIYFIIFLTGLLIGEVYYFYYQGKCHIQKEYPTYFKQKTKWLV